MGKVICIFTKEEITTMPATAEEGQALIENLLRFELSRSQNELVAPVALIEDVIRMVEVNTGASRYDAMDKVYGRNKSST
jgi:hypothetical protein